MVFVTDLVIMGERTQNKGMSQGVNVLNALLMRHLNGIFKNNNQDLQNSTGIYMMSFYILTSLEE